MSQIGGKMSKFYGETDIVSTDLRIILSRQTFTRFLENPSKNLQHDVQNECSKKLQIWWRMAPLR